MSDARPGFAIDVVALAEDDGFEAFVHGLRCYDNPIPQQEIQRRCAWNKGWHEARDYIGGLKGMAA